MADQEQDAGTDEVPRSSVTRVGAFDAGAEEVWAIARDFGGIARYMPGLDDCEVEGEGIGQLRRVPSANGVVVESLDARDDEARTMTYSIVEGPLPFRDYSATMAVDDDAAGGSTLTWTGTFFAAGIPVAKAEHLAGRVYEAGIAGFKQALGE